MTGNYNLVPNCDRCKKRLTVLEVTFNAQGVYLHCICARCDTAGETDCFANFNELIPLAIKYGSKYEVSGHVKN
jgi:hypothetical protein